MSSKAYLYKNLNSKVFNVNEVQKWRQDGSKYLHLRDSWKFLKAKLNVWWKSDSNSDCGLKYCERGSCEKNKQLHNLMIFHQVHLLTCSKAWAVWLCLRLYVECVTSQNLNGKSVVHHSTRTWKHTEWVGSTMAFGQAKPVWKKMQKHKCVISVSGLCNTSRPSTAYRENTVWLKASSTSLPSLWCRKRSETTLKGDVYKWACSKINHHLGLLLWKTVCKRQS